MWGWLYNGNTYSAIIKFSKPKKAEEKGSACDEPRLRKISRFDPLNNSARFKSGDLAKGERAPFEYGMQCVAQCRDPEGATSGRDINVEEIYMNPAKKKS